ncbi:hypothetical protein CPB84DRAFT_1752552 [Gymnopilus junonius]|uniref:Uncharacterized protein n=1 Tax=Gymnopilus junonius TaxID=109634 RepID=A0A9P5TFX3_GYMJU|nr:hypothetical protein CPB84DRAFT_1752552 [Gymnopilus junonius]
MKTYLGIHHHWTASIPHDPYLNFPILRAQLWSASINEIEIIEPLQVACHFACLPLVLEEQELVVVIPLSRFNAGFAFRAPQKALEQQQLNSERQFHDLESSLKEDASNKILLAEKRAQTMLKDIQGLGLGICLPMFHDHHRTDSHSSANGSAMIVDEQETHPPVNKGKQHAKGKSSEIESSHRSSHSPNTYFKQPKLNGDSVHFKGDVAGSDGNNSDNSDNGDSGEDMHHSKSSQPNTDEISKLTAESIQNLRIWLREQRNAGKNRLDICLDNLPKKVNEIVTTQQQAWKTKYDIIQALGPEGMSSDESDTDSDTKTYIVKKVAWHNKWLTGIIKNIDAAQNDC